MILSKTIIEKLQKEGFEAYYAKETARDMYLKIKNNRKYIYISTSAGLPSIKSICTKLNLRYSIYKKINKLTIELIIENKYIIAPFIKTTIKNSYASRKFSKDRLDALATVDFTINSIMYDPIKNEYKSYSGTEEDIKNKLIRAVGNPHDKITENRMFILECGRLLADLGNDWKIDYDTFEAIKQRALEISIVSVEPIRDVFSAIMRESNKPSLAFKFYKNVRVFDEILPQLMRSIGLPQSNKANNLDLFTHIMLTLDSIDKNKPNYVALRWAAIFHDIAKPYTKSFDKKGNIHFYGHDKIGAIFAIRWLEYYKFNKKLIHKVSIICKNHLFDASLKLDSVAIKRLIRRVGKDNIFDLINMREADRYGTGRAGISMKKVEVLRNKVKKLI